MTPKRNKTVEVCEKMVIGYLTRALKKAEKTAQIYTDTGNHAIHGFCAVYRVHELKTAIAVLEHEFEKLK